MLDYARLGTCHPKLARGRVWCRHCGSTQAVNSGAALRSGWPKCCGYTMTIDAPVEPAPAPPPQGVNATGAEAFPDNHLNEGA